MKCVTCHGPLKGKQTKYCCRKCRNVNLNIEFNTYTQQKERATKRKIQLVNLSGGKCKECGYNKNLAALEFHHLDPTQKENGLDSRKLSNSTLEFCLEEVKKCILLCCRCHREAHYPYLNGW